MHVKEKKHVCFWKRRLGIRRSWAASEGRERREDICWITREAGGTWKTDLKEERSLTKILREFTLEYLMLNPPLILSYEIIGKFYIAVYICVQ